MTSFNNTSKVLPQTNPQTLEQGVVLPHSSKIISENDIDSRINKTKNHINHLSESQAHRKTHGGKRFRARQISIRNQIEIASKQLTLLNEAKVIIVKLNNESHQRKLNLLSTAARITGAKSVREDESSYTFFAGKMRKITVLHANY